MINIKMKNKSDKKINVKSIGYNAALNVLYTITNMVFPLITYPYVARVISAAGMGKVSFFTSVSNYAVMFASLGISTYGIRAVAKVRDDKNKLSDIASELLVINTIITCFVLTVLLCSVPFVSKFSAEPVLLIINILIIFATPFGLNWLYSGLEQYSYITKRTILFKALSLILVFVFVRGEGDYPIYAGLTAFSTIGSYICNWFYARRFVDFHLSKNLQFKQHFKPTILLFASILAVSVYTNLDTIMLGVISDDRQVGLYTVASKIKWLLLSAINAVSAVLLPRLSNYIGNNEIEKYYQTLRKSVSFVFIITIPLTIFFMCEAYDSIYFLGGQDYTEAVQCMFFLMPILIISGFSNVTGNQVLIPQGGDLQFMNAVCVGAVMDILLNILLMPRYKCMGAAAATLFAEMTQMSIQFYYSRKDLMKNIDFKTLSKAAVAGSMAGCVIIIVRKRLLFNAIINLIITCLIFGLIYVFCLIIFREPYTKEILKRLKHREEKR